jgi:hypothetical protein
MKTSPCRINGRTLPERLVSETLLPFVAVGFREAQLSTLGTLKLCGANESQHSLRPHE